MVNWVPAVLPLITLALAACGGGPTGGPGAGDEPTAESATGEVELDDELSVYNWEDYIDEQVLRDYEERYGVTIIYDTFASNEDLLTKLQAGAAGGALASSPLRPCATPSPPSPPASGGWGCAASRSIRPPSPTGSGSPRGAPAAGRAVSPPRPPSSSGSGRSRPPPSWVYSGGSPGRSTLSSPTASPG